MSKIAIVVFPGSNCDRDVEGALTNTYGCTCATVQHTENQLPAETSLVILPGGFSYGDYLRAGALARLSPIMQAVKQFAQAGGKVMGICNGFQILCEMGLLPGVLLPNWQGRFICEIVNVNFYGSKNRESIPLRLPIAHNEGRFYADEKVLQELHSSGMIALTYNELDKSGRSKINGSERAIAGIYGGINKNILGLMPHPERMMDRRLGSEDGRTIFADFASLN